MYSSLFLSAICGQIVMWHDIPRPSQLPIRYTHLRRCWIVDFFVKVGFSATVQRIVTSCMFWSTWSHCLSPLCQQRTTVADGTLWMDSTDINQQQLIIFSSLNNAAFKNTPSRAPVKELRVLTWPYKFLLYHFIAVPIFGTCYLL